MEIASHIGFAAGEAIRLAMDFWASCAPNPAVGCTLLDENGELLAKGAHQHCGQPHAEINAIEQARKADLLPRARHLFTTLEPCAHHGKTPPCVNVILAESQITDVWIGAADPNSAAAGGAGLLSRAGRRVHFLDEIGELRTAASACAALLQPFQTRLEKKRPFVTVKQALDARGSMIPPAGSKTFTSPAALQLAHLLRRETGAILTTPATIRADAPRFTIRYVAQGPLAETTPKIIAVIGQSGIPENWRRERLASGRRVAHFKTPEEALAGLADQGINWALVEAGPTLLGALRKTDLWDEWLTIQQKSDGSEKLTLENARAEEMEERPLSPTLLLEKYAGDFPKGLKITRLNPPLPIPPFKRNS